MSAAKPPIPGLVMQPNSPKGSTWQTVGIVVFVIGLLAVLYYFKQRKNGVPEDN